MSRVGYPGHLREPAQRIDQPHLLDRVPWNLSTVPTGTFAGPAAWSVHAKPRPLRGGKENGKLREGSRSAARRSPFAQPRTTGTSRAWPVALSTCHVDLRPCGSTIQ